MKECMSGRVRKILVIPESHVSIGLFNDLYDTQVEVFIAKLKPIQSPIFIKLRALHLYPSLNRMVHIPFKNKWYIPISLDVDPQEETQIIIVDAALQALELKYLNRICNCKNTRCSLLLLNSMDAHSPGMMRVKDDFTRVNWESVITFDWHDAQKYNYRYLGCCYYSKHDEQRVMEKYGTDAFSNDVYFVGGIKGGRERMILDILSFLNGNNVVTDFNIYARNRKQVGGYGGINYYGDGWMPYEKVLAHVMCSSVILEILQEGQYGPSIRYYEAVCYNKKLLTNNQYITDLPYYDKRYMRVFQDVSDIDVNWLLKDEEIDYGYKGEFSPISLFDKVFNDN